MRDGLRIGTRRVCSAFFVIFAATFLYDVCHVQGADGKDEPEAISRGFEILALFQGPWRVTERHLDSDGEISVTVSGTEEVTWLYEDRVIQRAYLRPGQSESYRASGFLTYNATQERYEGVWFNSQSREGPIDVTGTWNESAKTMVFSLTRRDGKNDEELFRITEAFTSDSQRESTTYQVRDGMLRKIMETQYVRSKPCPAKIRGLYTN